MKMLEQIGLLSILSFSYITYNQVCIVIHQGLENIETFSSRPRRFLQDQHFYFKNDHFSCPRGASRLRPRSETTSLVHGVRNRTVIQCFVHVAMS